MANDNPSPSTRFAVGNKAGTGGRPKLIREFYNFLKDEAYDDANKALTKCLRSDNETVQLKAVAIVYERIFGKTPLPIVGYLGIQSGPRPNPLANLTDEELAVIEGVAGKLMLPAGDNGNDGEDGE